MATTTNMNMSIPALSNQVTVDIPAMGVNFQTIDAEFGLSGPTENRPTTGLYVGRKYFDTTLNQLVIWNGTTWVTGQEALTINVKWYGAKGDGINDDASAIQSAINAASTNGGTVYFPPGTYLCGSTLIIPSSVHLWGSGIGGDTYTDTDSRQPRPASMIKRKAGFIGDLIQTKNFYTVTGQANPPAFTVPQRYGIHNIVLDGNNFVDTPPSTTTSSSITLPISSTIALTSVPSSFPQQGTVSISNGTDWIVVSYTGISGNNLTGCVWNYGTGAFNQQSGTIASGSTVTLQAICLRMYGASFVIDNVVIQNGLTGNVYSEYGNAGYDMLAQWSNFWVTNANGDEMVLNGPHDSQYTNGAVWKPGHTSDAYACVRIPYTGNGGGVKFTSVHAWGAHTYSWVLGQQGLRLMNCTADGCGIRFLNSDIQWMGGDIYSISSQPGLTLIEFGDGVNTYNISGIEINAPIKGIAKGSAMFRIRNGVNMNYCRFKSVINSGGNTRGLFGEGLSTLSSGISSGATTIPLVSTSGFPSGGGSLYISDGTNISAASYTGVSGNTLTGVTGVGSNYAAGAYVWLLASDVHNWWDILDTQGTWFFFQNATGPLHPIMYWSENLQIQGNVGFNNSAPIAKPTVTGSKGGNAALASLITALANYGLITDSTT
jgi:hypothetical protein